MSVNIQQYKLKEISKFNQLVLLNDKGYIVESCDSIFDASSKKEISVLEWFPFLESIFPILLDLKKGDPDLKYTKMTRPLLELPGYYDFSFSKVAFEKEDFILWSIYDYTSLYEDFIEYQQKRNELEIHRQLLEKNIKSLKNQKEILHRKNLELSDLNELQKAYYQKIKGEIISPLNTLDGLTFILSNLLEESAYHQDYVTALRISTKHLQKIISELEYFKANESSGFKDELQAFNIVDTIKKVIATFKGIQSELSAEILYQIEDNVPASVTGDLTSFRQILYSLLVNVYLHQPKKEIMIQISRKGEDESHCTLLIKVGAKSMIESEGQLSQSFDTAIHDKDLDARELILRLFVVKKLIELQNGMITIERIPAYGAQVTCKLDFGLAL